MNWFVISAICQGLTRTMADSDEARQELAARVGVLMSVPDVDPVRQVVWGHRLQGAGEEHPLHKKWGQPMSEKGGVVTHPLSFRGGLEELQRQGWMETDWPTCQSDDEDEEYPVEIPAYDEADLLEEMRLIERDISLTPCVVRQGDEWVVNPRILRLLSELKYVQGDPLGPWETAPLEVVRSTPDTRRVVEAYESSPQPWRGSRYYRPVDPERAAQANRTSGGGFDLLLEEQRREQAWSDFLSDGEIERDGENGGQQVATYLKPEYPHDTNEVEWVLDFKIRQKGIAWLANAAKRGTAEAGLQRVAQIAAPLSPTEQAALARELAARIAAAVGYDEEIKRAVSESLLDFMADRGLDLDDEDVQFHAEEGGLNLDDLPYPDEWEIGRVNDPVEQFVRAIGDLLPVEAPWHTQEARRAEAREALRVPCSWNHAARVGRDALWSSPRAAQFRTRKQSRELVVAKLTPAGVADGNGRSATWADLHSGRVQVVFDTRDGGSRLKAAIAQYVKDPLALEWAARF